MSRTAPKRPIEAHQIKNLHILKTKLGLDDEAYRMALGQFVTAKGGAAERTKELTWEQAEMLITKWAEQAGHMGLTVNLYRGPNQKVCSKGQLDAMRYYAIRCAITYAPLGVYDIGGGNFLEGDELRAWMLRRWKAKAMIPQTLLRSMFEKWINPKSNEFLIEAGHISQAHASQVNPKYCYYDRLSSAAAMTLINRFRFIAQQLGYGETQMERMQ